jgi:hypothetical protein
MSGWILAHGRSQQQSLGDVTAAGATSIALAGADAIFAPGDWLFVSEADGSEAQWLGRVTQTTFSAVSFSRPLAFSKNSGALLWRADSALATPTEGALPERRSIVPGVAVERTRAGDWFAVQVAEPAESLALALEGLTPQAERDALDWIAAAIGWGLSPFAVIDPAGAMYAARLAGEPIVRERSAGGRRRLVLPIALVEEGAYP